MSARFCPWVVLGSLLWIHTTLSQESEIRLSASVDRTEVPLNRTVELTLRLTWSGEPDRYQIHPFDNPITQNFEIVANASSNRVTAEGGLKTSITDYLFTLEPSSLGMGYIEGVIVTYSDLSTSESFRLTTNRIAVKVIDPVPEPGSRPRWLPGLGGVLLIFGIGLGLYLFRRRSKIRSAPADAAGPAKIEQLLLEQLRTVDLDDPNLDVTAGFDVVSKITRRFLTARYGAPGPGATTAQVIEALKGSALPPRLATEVEEILRNADLSKFSGGGAECSDFQRAWTLVEAMLEKSMRDEPGPDNTDSQQ